jgi:hypothetical protein
MAMIELNDEDMFGGGNNIKADDVATAGKQVVTIETVGRVTYPGKDGKADETKDVLVFTDGRSLTVNATRRQQLVELFGYPLKVSNVKGKDIELTTAKVNSPTGGRVNSVMIGAHKGAF